MIGLAKNAQQVLHYSLYGMVGNYLNERVLTPLDVYPADHDDIKLHFGFKQNPSAKISEHRDDLPNIDAFQKTYNFHLVFE
jgi:hypothetical protein